MRPRRVCLWRTRLRAEHGRGRRGGGPGGGPAGGRGRRASCGLRARLRGAPPSRRLRDCPGETRAPGPAPGECPRRRGTAGGRRGARGRGRGCPDLRRGARAGGARPSGQVSSGKTPAALSPFPARGAEPPGKGRERTPRRRRLGGGPGSDPAPFLSAKVAGAAGRGRQAGLGRTELGAGPRPGQGRVEGGDRATAPAPVRGPARPGFGGIMAAAGASGRGGRGQRGQGFRGDAAAATGPRSLSSGPSIPSACTAGGDPADFPVHTPHLFEGPRPPGTGRRVGGSLSGLRAGVLGSLGCSAVGLGRLLRRWVLGGGDAVAALWALRSPFLVPPTRHPPGKGAGFPPPRREGTVHIPFLLRALRAFDGQTFFCGGDVSKRGPQLAGVTWPRTP